MKTVKIFTLPPRFPLILPPAICSSGPATEAMTSVFRGICETNHLAMRAVIKQMSFVGTSRYLPLVSCEYPLYAANHGIKVTNDIHTVIETLTGYEAAQAHSFAPWNARDPARPIVSLNDFRKWCPACYLDDALSENRIYDRLAWMPKGVELCTEHGTRLESSCLNCGNNSFSFIRNNDVAGYCPKCHAWLGGAGRTYPRDHDEQVRYRWWIAQCVVEMLEKGVTAKTPLFENLAIGINTAINYHFEGNGTSAAMHIGRSKSLVSQWRNGVVAPSWEALCEISYAFQISIHALLNGDSDAIAFSTLAKLPSQIVLDRPRPISRKRDIDYPAIEKLMLDITIGKHPAITKFRQIGEQFQIHRTTPKKRFPELAAQVEKTLSKRRQEMRTHRERRRLLALCEEIKVVTLEFVNRNQQIRRRPLVDELKRRGFKLGHEDYVSILALAKQTAALNPTTGSTVQLA